MISNLRAKKIFPDTENGMCEENKIDNAASSFIVNNAIKYIENNYDHKITLLEVAEKTYISQWHLSKLLNRNLGQSFSEILNNVRIKEAQKLLKNPSLRIGDIADKVGFIDIAHFSRVFKKIMGISANEYRNSILAKDIESEE
jgi:YesN/AraC family two-component response regulator